MPNENPSGINNGNGNNLSFKFNIRFMGQYWDEEKGTSYNYFKDYANGLGRYIQSDPIGLNAGVNTYGYVSANPLSNIDLYGLDTIVFNLYKLNPYASTGYLAESIIRPAFDYNLNKLTLVGHGSVATFDNKSPIELGNEIISGKFKYSDNYYIYNNYYERMKKQKKTIDITLDACNVGVFIDGQSYAQQLLNYLKTKTQYNNIIIRAPNGSTSWNILGTTIEGYYNEPGMMKEFK